MDEQIKLYNEALKVPRMELRGSRVPHFVHPDGFFFDPGLSYSIRNNAIVPSIVGKAQLYQTDEVENLSKFFMIAEEWSLNEECIVGATTVAGLASSLRLTQQFSPEDFVTSAGVASVTLGITLGLLYSYFGYKREARKEYNLALHRSTRFSDETSILTTLNSLK